MTYCRYNNSQGFLKIQWFEAKDLTIYYKLSKVYFEVIVGTRIFLALGAGVTRGPAVK